METQLQDIITRIHDEGVKGAEERAHAIIQHAEKQAQEQVRKARSEAEQIIKDAKQESAQLRSAGEAALQQAGRDLVLSVQKQLEALFNTVMAEAAGEALSSDEMARVIAGLVEKWYEVEQDDLTVLVPENDRDALEKTLRDRLGKKARAGVTIQPVRSMTTGFRIASRDGASYYDVTDGTLTELLSAYLNPRLTEIMRNAGE
jgi:V/A-type H+/Na+-transporting ATPase subunit E